MHVVVDAYASPSQKIPPACTDLIKKAMRGAFGLVPYDWQELVGSHLNQMTVKRSGVAPNSVFLCRPTAGGKSMVRDTFAAGQGGVTWCITPLLSLGADQVTNINKHSLQGDGTVVGIHIDTVNHGDVRSVCDKILTMEPNDPTTVIILSSPQAVTNTPSWAFLFRQLLIKNLLVMVCVDEAHLFVQFGLYFRKEFAGLKHKLFSHINTSPLSTKVPVLFMTATATARIVKSLEQMTGLVIEKSNVFWPSPCAMVSRGAGNGKPIL